MVVPQKALAVRHQPGSLPPLRRRPSPRSLYSLHGLPNRWRHNQHHNRHTKRWPNSQHSSRALRRERSHLPNSHHMYNLNVRPRHSNRNLNGQNRNSLCPNNQHGDLHRNSLDRPLWIPHRNLPAQPPALQAGVPARPIRRGDNPNLTGANPTQTGVHPMTVGCPRRKTPGFPAHRHPPLRST